MTSTGENGRLRLVFIANCRYHMKTPDIYIIAKSCRCSHSRHRLDVQSMIVHQLSSNLSTINTKPRRYSLDRQVITSDWVIILWYRFSALTLMNKCPHDLFHHVTLQFPIKTGQAYKIYASQRFMTCVLMHVSVWPAFHTLILGQAHVLAKQVVFFSCL